MPGIFTMALKRTSCCLPQPINPTRISLDGALKVSALMIEGAARIRPAPAADLLTNSRRDKRESSISLGCYLFLRKGILLPNSPPAISMARLAITSLTFMLDWVPLPVIQTCRGKWSSNLPSSAHPESNGAPGPQLCLCRHVRTDAGYF